MIPATFPGFPVTIFPGLLMPSFMAGASVVDVTAAIAVIAWGLGGLVALRIAILMSRGSDRSVEPAAHDEPTKPHGLRDAA